MPSAEEQEVDGLRYSRCTYNLRPSTVIVVEEHVDGEIGISYLVPKEIGTARLLVERVQDPVGAGHGIIRVLVRLVAQLSDPGTLYPNSQQPERAARGGTLAEHTLQSS